MVTSKDNPEPQGIAVHHDYILGQPRTTGHNPSWFIQGQQNNRALQDEHPRTTQNNRALQSIMVTSKDNPEPQGIAVHHGYTLGQPRTTGHCRSS
ncbi:unnamed protein product [Mytilus coruscus]|uniref:Uncharacterized protein n=1 Tax=Mytilus coruscus TaxID=42192 RepID=A0A6J8AE26_MYTCO|nr:unnamed protein product [Mytilus coruscus]